MDTNIPHRGTCDFTSSISRDIEAKAPRIMRDFRPGFGPRTPSQNPFVSNHLRQYDKRRGYPFQTAKLLLVPTIGTSVVFDVYFEQLLSAFDTSFQYVLLFHARSRRNRNPIEIVVSIFLVSIVHTTLDSLRSRFHSVQVLALIVPVVGSVVVRLGENELRDTCTPFEFDVVVDLQQPFTLPLVTGVPNRRVEHAGVPHER